MSEAASQSSIDISLIKKKSFSGAVSYFLRTILLQGIGIVSVLILSAYLSPEDFGIYGFVVIIIGILGFFSDIGLAAALVQKEEEPTQTDYATAFTVQQILSWLIVGIAGVFIASGFVEAKGGTAGVWILLALAFSFPLAALKTIPSIILERKLDFSKLVIPQVVEQIIFNGILIFLVWNQMGVLAYAYAVIARSVVGVIVMYFIQPWKISVKISKTSLKSMISYGFKFQMNDLLARIKDQLFFALVASYLPSRDFGFIQWSKTWSMYPYNLTVQNIMAITFPTFSRLQNEKYLLQRAIEKSLFFISLVIFPMLVGMVVFIQPFIELVPSYHKWQPALLSFILFTLSIGWSAISTPLTNTLNAVGEINTTLKLMIMWTVLTWIVTPICLYFFGFTGVAVAAFIISFTSLIPVYYVKKIVPISVWDQVWRQLLAAAGMAIVGFVWLEQWSGSWKWLIAGAVLLSAVYGLILLLVGRKKVFAELQILRTMRQK